MPHQCVRCNRTYPDGSAELLHGCNCGGKFFFFVKEAANIPKAEKIVKKLTNDDKKQIEKDVLEIVGEPENHKKPVILDIEAIKVLKPGKYELDIKGILKGKPLVYKIDEGKYIIDVASTFAAKELEIKEDDDNVQAVDADDIKETEQEQKATEETETKEDLAEQKNEEAAENSSTQESESDPIDQAEQEAEKTEKQEFKQL